MIRFYFLLSALLLLSAHASGQTPVWSTDIAPLLYQNCASCHRPGGVGPMPLISYLNALNYAGSIKGAVQSRRMPPWPPDPSYNRLAHERLLEQSDIQKIIAWADGGAPQGDPNLAPPVPSFSSGAMLSATPELSLKIPDYTSTAGVSDEYRCFVIPAGTSIDRFITALEVIPGNRGIVHHVLVFADTSGACAQLDAQDPAPGYSSFGGVGTSDAMLLGGWVPGTAPLVLPGGFGIKLLQDADIVVQIHYPAGSGGQLDSTRVNLHLAPAATALRQTYIMPVLNHTHTLVNGPLLIPPNQTRTFREQFVMPGIDFSLLGVAPHMHLIGRSIKAFGVTPQQDTLRFISVPNWNFHWQGFYLMRRVQKIPANSTVWAEAFYDNTTANPFNPSSPPQLVTAGEATTDEMMLTYFIFSLYEPGDEHIVLDSTTPVHIVQAPGQPLYQGLQLLAPYPNPARDEVVVKCHFDYAAPATIDLLDAQGRVVRRLMQQAVIPKGYSTRSIGLDGIAAGMYWLRLQAPGSVVTQPLVIQ